MTLIRRLLPVLQPIRRAWWFVARPRTTGARAVVFDEDGWIVLVRHAYEAGASLPGGGVKRGETPEAAVRRELAEEIGLRRWTDLAPFAVYVSSREHKRDTVHLFTVRGARLAAVESAEISAIVRAPPEALPEDATPATRRRIAEVLGRNAAGGAW